MAEFQSVQSRNPIQTVPVTADDSTVEGNGTPGHPLTVIGGSVSVDVDDVTIAGNGTDLSPLHTIPFETPVKTDGSSIVGNGTPGNPLAAVGGPSGAGNSDGVTLQGTGLLVNPYAIKAVQHDTSLAGNGTVAVPLTLAIQHDNSLAGAGTASVPLALSIQHDGTLTGAGTAASPLSTVEGTTGVAVDGSTIGGNGTTGTPLHVIPSGLDQEVTVAVDGTTISGNGLTATPLHVDPLGLSDQVPVATDGVTIGGNGTSGSPLTLLSAPGAIHITYVATGSEGTDFLVPLGTTLASTNYTVFWAPAGMQAVPLADFPSSGRTTTHFEVQLSAPPFAGDTINFVVFF